MALNIERLEPRILLTASIKQSGTSLVIKGDAANDTIEVEGAETPGSMIVRVDLNNDGHFHDDGEVQTFHGVNNVAIRTGNGHDSVQVEGLQISGRLQIQTGAGNDAVSVNGAEIGRNVNIQAGNGDDEVSLGLFDGVTIGGQLAINLGSGNDTLLTNDIDVTGQINVNGSAGFDQIIDLGETSFLNNLRLKNIVPGQLPNAEPTATNDDFIVSEDATVSGNLISDDNGHGLDGDADASDVLTITAINGDSVSDGDEITLDSGALLTISADGAFSYNTNGAFDSLPVGETETDSFTYTVSDGHGGTSTATVTVTITGVNDAPVAQNDAITTDQDSEISGNLLVDNGNGADSDADDDTLKVSKINSTYVTKDNQSITLTSGAKLTISRDGTYQYDPNGKFDSLKVGETATDSFTYTLSDGNGGHATATVTVTITGLNDSPTARNDSFTVDERKTISNKNVLLDNGKGADSDPDGDPLTITKFNGQDLVLNQQYSLNYGKITWSTSGGKTVFSYTAGSISGGDKTETFTYTISDGNGGASTATVSIKVEND